MTHGAHFASKTPTIFPGHCSEATFARAATQCNVSQPTLSAGLVALEEQLGKRLVDRDRRFMGLTAHGEAILPWAQQILAASENMVRAAEVADGPLRGELRFGAIPASMPVTSYLIRALFKAHPQLTVSSMSSREIERDLANFKLDVGITYLDHEPPANMLTVPLYAEQYLFVMRNSDPITLAATMGWAEATPIRSPFCTKACRTAASWMRLSPSVVFR